MHSRTVEFPEHCPNAVLSTLKFFYDGTYTIEKLPGKEQNLLHLLMAPLNVYALANYIMVPYLKTLATVRMRDEFLAVKGALVFCSTRDALWRQARVPGYIDAVYNITNNEPGHAELRKVAVEVCRDCLVMSMGLNWKVLKNVLKNHPDFAEAVFGSMVEFTTK